MKIPKIVITGGPCAGKTTCLAYLIEKLSDLGFNVFLIPETATAVINSGFDPRKFSDSDQLLRIEELMFKLQLKMEKECVKTASNISKKPLILCDRGMLDMMAYIPDNFNGAFEMMATEEKTSILELRDSYAGVIHLTTAAIGAEKYYSLTNNKARRETLEDARLLDEKTKNCWLGHPHFKVIDNSTDFENKIRRTMAAICRFLSIPTPVEIERKFLVKDLSFFKLSDYQKIDIEQIYLATENPNEEIRLRKRGQNGSFMYFLTKKQKTENPRIRNETEQMISWMEFMTLCRKKDPSKEIIKKKRYCFLDKNQYFELDVFEEPTRLQKLILLEIELTEENDKVEIPWWINVAREVTNEPAYSNFSLASGLV